MSQVPTTWKSQRRHDQELVGERVEELPKYAHEVSLAGQIAVGEGRDAIAGFRLR